ncbi:lipopolysaccharide biosynthesis protein RfbH [Candidatus Nitrospira inopinata]|jgi:CDP-6-deoxy-D-xylo-4-hexulose-3-dehydrase|uniref:Lipopolysaccharide biosynthesis protein RfbH n=1 Tax=Candidatus Nitrospira inopinata TaxID=1715989 RepID=A0A0S4KVM7_9BACT|nr:lipopolysaccharide biosynthesis protein RfbH [Candidatus Nitrospira inopinata]CUQ67226.1 Lipopolysaccharide biosynthesis protein RfbH [Candidatus Nitrospira inopinata]
MTAANVEVLKEEILRLVGQYAEEAFKDHPFVPDGSPVPASGKVIGAPELQNAVEAALDGWLTAGRFNDQFEDRLATVMGVKYALTTNSGSSANLLALSALTSPEWGERALRPGDEIITVATGFPTTVNPILLLGAVPVFVDVSVPTYNVDVAQLEQAVSEKTKAIVLAHTLGNPFDVARVMRVARQYGLWVIEDCCDALGSTYEGKPVGTFGDIGTLSFYPAHHITTGEGGAVVTNNTKLKRVLESFRDWGRDCYCPPGRDNTCGRRYCWQRGELPKGYDHKYIYTHAGYNLKMTDFQAAVGLAQLERLPDFIKIRKRNFHYLKEGLADLQEWLMLPEATPRSDPSWFGFPIMLRPGAPITRVELLESLDRHRIGSRLLFGGNLTRQPYMRGRLFRVHEELSTSDLIMNQAFWVGVYPGLDRVKLDFVIETITRTVKEKQRLCLAC